MINLVIVSIGILAISIFGNQSGTIFLPCQGILKTFLYFFRNCLLPGFNKGNEACHFMRSQYLVNLDMKDILDQLILGIKQYSKGRIDDAMAIAQDVLEKAPDNAIGWMLYGNCNLASGKYEDSIAHFRKALLLDPELKDAMVPLTKALRLKGEYQEAIKIYNDLLDQDPSNSTALLSLGDLLYEVQRYEESEKTLRLTLKTNPTLTFAHVLLGRIAKARNAGVDDAIGHCLDAIATDPEDSIAYNDIGNYLIRAGDPVAACNAFQKVMDLTNKKNPLVYSNLLLTQHYRDDISPKELFESHRGWQKSYENRCNSRDKLDFKNRPDPNKKLRIGFTSADLRQHSVFNFLHGLFKSYDRENFEFICFSSTSPRAEDKASEILKSHTDEWHVIHQISPQKACEKIISSQIDVLIDLSGHTGDNCLPIYLRRAAPVQVTWLGYPDTTGLDTMDYRLVDSITDPEPWADELASEHLYRLPVPFICYHPHPDCYVDPKPNMVPERIVFGTFNEAPKFSPSVLRIWCEILKRIPDAELVIKCRPFGEEKTKTFVMDNMRKYGIDESRVKLLAFIQKSTGHMSTYDVMDVALDPFPYNGTTTSCEALWMGVPMITRAGDRHCARVGMSLLSSIGLDDWIAHSDEEYIEKAVQVANDRENLLQLKKTLRSRMQNSPLCDHQGFARKFETSLRDMWNSWCKAKHSSSHE